MTTGHDPPPANPRQAKGFLVTLSLPPTVPASRLEPCDVFALPEQPRHPLTMDDVRPHPVLTGRLLVDLRGVSEPLTLCATEPVHPLSMPRRVEVTCQLCEAMTTMPLDLVTHGEPQTWVCRLH
ncbi:hypothetical protein [Streptomyces sp. NPDC048419]|uniref:hypothetical protein n=1 Tax=Streptomyces sp. NPDC048419 TaxID=3365547 RepID=UPI00371092F4